MFKLLAVSLAALMAVPAIAADPAPATSDTKKNEKKVLCKREAKTGSLVAPKRTCLTVADWERSQTINRKNVEDWQQAVDSSRRAN
jgi:outer membrane cobalamin receptor